MNIHSLQLSELAEHHDLRCGLGLVQYKDVRIGFKTSHKPSVLLGDVLSLEYGSGLTDEERSGSGYPVVGSNGIVGYHYDYLIEGPAIIVGRKGSAGEVTYIPTGCYPIDTTFYVSLKSDLYDLKFLYYVLKMLKLQRLALFKGVPGLNRFDVYEIFIPVISKQEQEEIIKEISPLEDQIQELKALAGDPTRPINEVFAREFGINIDQLDQSNRETIFHRTMRDISKDDLFRFSTHYQKNVFLEDLFQDGSTWHDITCFL